MWCLASRRQVIVSSPLTLSHDVNDDAMSEKIWSIISNKEALEARPAPPLYLYFGSSPARPCTLPDEKPVTKAPCRPRSWANSSL
jgi:hypothetical protein